MGHTRFKGSNVAGMGNRPYKFVSQVKKEQKAQARVTKELKTEVETKSELDGLKEEYIALAGKPGHHLWKEKRYKEEIDKLKE